MVASKEVLETLLARVRERARPPGVAASPSTPARAVQLADDEVEEYEDELIEIIDDREVQSSPATSPPPSALPQPAAVEAAPSVPAAAERFAAATVRRSPVAAVPVIDRAGARPEPRELPFLELLDASLRLGG